jgi:hypothetical protein
LAAAIRTHRPTAVWVGSGEDVARFEQLDPVVVAVTDDADVADAISPVARARGGDVIVFGSGVDTARVPFMAPFVRARWRARERLPARLVVAVETGASDDLGADAIPTGLALAAAVAVRGEALLDAMAWGAPCVTDHPSAVAAGAKAGRDVVVAEHADLRPAAQRLAADDVEAAVLSRNGRRLVERRHDRSRPPRLLVRRLGLVGRDPAGRVGDQLDDLWTPPRAAVRERVNAALAGLGASG